MVSIKTTRKFIEELYNVRDFWSKAIANISVDSTQKKGLIQFLGKGGNPMGEPIVVLDKESCIDIIYNGNDVQLTKNELKDVSFAVVISKIYMQICVSELKNAKKN